MKWRSSVGHAAPGERTAPDRRRTSAEPSESRRASCEADPIAQSCIGVARRTSSLVVPYTHELKHSGWSSPSSGAASERSLTMRGRRCVSVLSSSKRRRAPSPVRSRLWPPRPVNREDLLWLYEPEQSCLHRPSFGAPHLRDRLAELRFVIARRDLSLLSLSTRIQLVEAVERTALASLIRSHYPPQRLKTPPACRLLATSPTTKFISDSSSSSVSPSSA